MATKSKKIEMIPISLIKADENQPRRDFNAIRLGELAKSIKKYGVKMPLTIEKSGDGFYILQDGERRWRAAKQIDLKEVPCIVEESIDKTERLIQQFHLQEQHENWSSIEKAVAISRMSHELGVGVTAVAEMLNLARPTIHQYVNFSKLIRKTDFEKNQVPIILASSINTLKIFVRGQYSKVLNEEFTKEMESGLELAIIEGFKQGSITKSGDLTKMRDAVKVNPRIIEKFIAQKTTPQKMFTETDARVAHHYRNIYNNAVVLGTQIKSGMALGVEKLFTEESTVVVNQLKHTLAQINLLLGKI